MNNNKIDNEYLNEKMKEILLNNNNFFDVILKLKEFEKEYKQSDFYKTTKINLIDLVKDARIFYLTNVKTITDKINGIINNLDAEKLAALIENSGEILENHNNATLDIIKEFKEFGGADIIKNQSILNEREKEE